MKRILLIACGLAIMALSQVAYGLQITPSTDSPYTGDDTSQAVIDSIVLGITGYSHPLYKATPGSPVAEEGVLAGSYETVFDDDNSDAVIEYVAGDIVGPIAYLLVKDGRQQPAWYLFNLTGLGWDGMEKIEVQGFWPNQGEISHVSLYGNRTGVPDGGTTMMLVGMAMIGLGALRRVLC